MLSVAARLLLQAIEKNLRLGRCLGPGRTSGGDLPFGTADAGLHLRVVKPELVVGHESCRHQLIGSAVRTLQEEEIAGRHTQRLAYLLWKGRAAFLVQGQECRCRGHGGKVPLPSPRSTLRGRRPAPPPLDSAATTSGYNRSGPPPSEGR